MERDQMRAGDGDRQQVAARLKQALDEGRLDLTEYDERLQKTYAAKTFGDLNGLLDDLPGTVPAQQSQVHAYQPPAAPASAPVEEEPGNRLAWLAPGLGIFLICTVVWLISSVGSGELQYFWPIWTVFPFVFGLVGMITGGSRRHDRRGRR